MVPFPCEDFHLTKVAADGTDAVYSTLLGGSSTEYGGPAQSGQPLQSVGVDGASNVMCSVPRHPRTSRAASGDFRRQTMALSTSEQERALPRL